MRIVVIGDMHCGHKMALTPDSYFNDTTNDYQKWVLGCWNDLVDRFKHPDYLILNGDLCDGMGVKNMGVECITTDIDEQADMAAELLAPMIGEKTSVKVLNGSGYHIGECHGMNGDARVAEKIGGEFVGFDYTLDIDNDRIQFAHGSGGGKMNPDTNIRQEMQLAINNAQKLKQKPPTMLVRSHIHRYFVDGSATIVGYVTPCWQYSSRFTHKMSANITSDIGGLIMEFNGDTKIYPKIYPVPLEVTLSMKRHDAVQAKKASRGGSTQEWAEAARVIKV